MHAGEDGHALERPRELHVVEPSERCAAEDALAVAQDPENVRDGSRGGLVIAGDHHDADPRRAAFLDGLLHAVAWGIDLSDEAEQRGAANLGEARRQIDVRSDGNREDAKRLRRPSSPMIARRRLGAHRRAARRAPFERRNEQRSSTCFWRSLEDDERRRVALVPRRHHLGARVEGHFR